jgi:hypothetical protein
MDHRQFGKSSWAGHIEEATRSIMVLNALNDRMIRRPNMSRTTL